ncbi:MAG: tRNA pseudouridine(55) synthase TruB, partial [Caldilineae bacterium]
MKPETLSGILNLNKPPALTSHDVVKVVRRLTGVRKVGHAGTLDPLATGVLLVCLGRATRLIEYLMAGRKVYRATLQLGQTTTTYDAEGDITATADPSAVTEAALRRTLAGFVGHIEQTPPPFSALKRNGVPLYRLARQGKAVTPAPRPVHIAAIELEAFAPPQATLRVVCGPGTYIRSLAHEVGQRLGVGAHLTALVRLASGNWSLENAITLPQLEEAITQNRLPDVLHPKEKAVAHLPRLT